MSYTSASRSPRGRLGPRLRPRSLRGLGDDIGETLAYYVALIETYDSNTHDRTYDWTDTRYLTVWDMNSWSLSLNKSLPNGLRQAPMVYSWDGSSWVMVWDETGTM